MKNSLLSFILISGLLGWPNVALANACHASAAAIASAQGGKVLKVQTKNNQNGVVCVVTMQVQPDPGKPPRVVTKQYRP